MKTAPGFVEKFKVGCHRNNVLVLFPLPSNLEVAQDFAGYIGFERVLDARAEAVFGAAKFCGSRGNVEQAKRLQVAEEPLIRREMRNKTPQASRPGIHETEGDHRRSTRDGSCEKEGELIDEITNGRAAASAALVNLRGESVLRNGERFAEEIDLVALGLQKVVRWILKEKVHLHESRADVVERVP